MTVENYIRERFSKYGVSIADADILDMSLSSGVSGEDEICGCNHTRVGVSIARFIPSLLLRGNSWSVSENGHSKSQSYDTGGIKEYYAYLCGLYGLDDELSDKPKARFL